MSGKWTVQGYQVSLNSCRKSQERFNMTDLVPRQVDIYFFTHNMGWVSFIMDCGICNMGTYNTGLGTCKTDWDTFNIDWGTCTMVLWAWYIQY